MSDQPKIDKLDRQTIAKFGGDLESESLRTDYLRYLDAWRKGEKGRLPTEICLELAVRYPQRQWAHTRRFVPNGGSGPSAEDLAAEDVKFTVSEVDPTTPEINDRFAKARAAKAAKAQQNRESALT